MWKCVTRRTPSSSTGETIARWRIFHDSLRGCAWRTKYICNLRWCETGGRKRRWKIAGMRRERKRKEDKVKKERGPKEIRYLRIQIKSPRKDTYEKRNQSLYIVFRAILRDETRELNLFNTLFIPTFVLTIFRSSLLLIEETFFS